MTENTHLLNKEEAHSEAIAVVKMSPNVMDAFQRAIEAKIASSSLQEEKKLLESQLGKIKNSSEAEKLQYTSEYLDSLRKRDPNEYRLTVNLHEQVGRLELMVGEDGAAGLIQEMNYEKNQVAETYNSMAQKVQAGFHIPNSAITGEAIERLSKRPKNGKIPAEAFGQLFSIDLAQSRLADYLSKQNTKG